MSFLNLAPQILSACFFSFLLDFCRSLFSKSFLPCLFTLYFLLGSVTFPISQFLDLRPESALCFYTTVTPPSAFFFFNFLVGCRSFLFLSSYQDFALPTAHFLISSVKLCYFNICLCDCICIC